MLGRGPISDPAAVIAIRFSHDVSPLPARRISPRHGQGQRRSPDGRGVLRPASIYSMALAWWRPLAGRSSHGWIICRQRWSTRFIGFQKAESAHQVIAVVHRPELRPLVLLAAITARITASPQGQG